MSKNCPTCSKKLKIIWRNGHDLRRYVSGKYYVSCWLCNYEECLSFGDNLKFSDISNADENDYSKSDNPFLMSCLYQRGQCNKLAAAAEFDGNWFR